MATTLRERYQQVTQTTSEENYQKGLREIVNKARQVAKTAESARQPGHMEASRLAKQGLVWDQTREHALVDFLCDVVKGEALDLKEKAQTTIIARRTFYPLSGATGFVRPTQVQRLKRIGII